MPEVICEWCGKEFHKNPYRMEHIKHHFCSNECRSKSRRNRLTVTCEWCEKIIERKASQIKKYKQHFCSNECRLAWRKSSSVIIICEYCGEKVTRWQSQVVNREHHFCSKNCYDIWQQHKSNMLSCQWCSKIFNRSPARTKRAKYNFCSQKCYGQWQSIHKCGKSSPNWKGGTAFLPYDTEFNEHRRQSVKKRDGNQCVICGIDEIEHIEMTNRHLSVHHIDYDKTNSRLSNLVTLCTTCHNRTQGNREEHKQLLTEYIAHIEQPESNKL